MLLPKKVLVIDEDHTALFLAQTAIKRIAAELQIQTAQSREEALALISAHCCQEQCFALVLLAIEKHLNEGITLLEELQQFLGLGKNLTPIVLVSSSQYYLDMVQALQYPIHGYIQKPLIPTKLVPYLG